MFRKREAREKKKEKKMKAHKVWHGVTPTPAPQTTQPIDLPPSQLRSCTPFVAPHISSPMQASSASKEPHTAPYCESSKCPAVISSKSSLVDTLWIIIVKMLAPKEQPNMSLPPAAPVRHKFYVVVRSTLALATA